MTSAKGALIRAVGRLGASPAGGAFRTACDRLSVRRAGLSRGGKFHILTYHRVLPVHDPLTIDCTSVPAFEAQMRRLAAHFRVAPLETVVGEARAGRVPPGSLCITFDDGYADNYLHAFPVLRKYGLPATVFLTTEPLGTDRMLWHDRVLHAFRALSGPRFTWAEAGMAEADISAPEGKRKAAFAVLGWLKAFAPAERDRRIADLWAREGVAPPGDGPMMLSWDQVREMGRSGISFGAHTRTHPILSRLPDREAEAEILESRRDIERELGAPCTLFAYPNGRSSDFTPFCKALLERHGFRCALTTHAGVNVPGQDAYELKRTPVWEPDMDQFHGRLLLERLFQG